MEPVAEKALDLLSKLGNTPEEMAQSLTDLGYKGVRYDGYLCPCGTYLQDQLHQPILVSQSVIEGPERPDYITLKDYGIKGKMISGFVLNFDQNKYPWLVKEKDIVGR